MDYDLELSKVLEKIKETKPEPKTICIQLPDGLKNRANEVQEFIEKNTGAKVIIYLGSCFGACDFPAWLDKHIDMLIAFGHSEWRY